MLGKYVHFSKNYKKILGKVLNISSDSLQVIEVLPRWYAQAPKIMEVIPFHVSKKKELVSYVDLIEEKYYATPIYLEFPKRIEGFSDSLEFFYDDKDFYLDQIVSKLRLSAAFEDMKRNVNVLFEYFDFPKHNFYEKESLGNILKSKQAFCRHRAALLFLLAKSEGANVQIECSRKDAQGQTHSFLSYYKNDINYILDPAQNLFGTRKNILNQLAFCKKPINYYTKTRKMQIDLIF